MNKGETVIASIITIMITKENLPSSEFIVDISLNVTWHNQYAYQNFRYCLHKFKITLL